jgi:hypothetical protein
VAPEQDPEAQVKAVIAPVLQKLAIATDPPDRLHIDLILRRLHLSVEQEFYARMELMNYSVRWDAFKQEQQAAQVERWREDQQPMRPADRKGIEDLLWHGQYAIQKPPGTWTNGDALRVRAALTYNWGSPAIAVDLIAKTTSEVQVEPAVAGKQASLELAAGMEQYTSAKEKREDRLVVMVGNLRVIPNPDHPGRNSMPATRPKFPLPPGWTQGSRQKASSPQAPGGETASPAPMDPPLPAAPVKAAGPYFELVWCCWLPVGDGADEDQIWRPQLDIITRELAMWRAKPPLPSPRPAVWSAGRSDIVGVYWTVSEHEWTTCGTILVTGMTGLLYRLQTNQYPDATGALAQSRLMLFRVSRKSRMLMLDLAPPGAEAMANLTLKTETGPCRPTRSALAVVYVAGRLTAGSEVGGWAYLVTDGAGHTSYQGGLIKAKTHVELEARAALAALQVLRGRGVILRVRTEELVVVLKGRQGVLPAWARDLVPLTRDMAVVVERADRDDSLVAEARQLAIRYAAENI